MKAILIPPQEVIDTIQTEYSYDTNTGMIYRKGKLVPVPLKSRYHTIRINLKSINRIQRYYIVHAHQVAWFLHYGNWPERFIDHVDGNGKNNRLDNLRLATHKENIGNRRKQSGCKSRFKGVFPVRAKWRSYIYHDHKIRQLGYFTTEEEAAKAYDKAAIELRGDFARLNFPSGPSND